MELLLAFIKPEQLILWIGGIIAGGTTAFFGWVFIRGKIRAETGKLYAERDKLGEETQKIHEEKNSIVVQQYDKLIDRLNIEYERLRERLQREQSGLLQRIEENTKIIHDLQTASEEDNRRILHMEKDNEECKYQHSIVGLELKLIKAQHQNIQPTKQIVCVLDDDEEVLEEFKEKFDKIAILDFCGFSDAEAFMSHILENRPEVIVSDYRLIGYTAEDIIEALPYKPEIFIMSGSPLPPSHRLRSPNIHFFLKEQHYVYKIAAAIIQHLNVKYELRTE